MTLWYYTPQRLLVRHPQPFSTYASAVTFGQNAFGYGKFMIDTGERVPSREEQLLEETVGERSLRRRAQRRAELLQTI